MAINKKAKGTAGERELIHKFWEAGFACFRAAGSGSNKYPCPDIIAGNANRRFALECKVTKDKSKYFSFKEIDDLIYFSKVFGCESYVSIKFSGIDWLFFSVHDLKLTKGNNYVVRHDEAQLFGISFENLINLLV